MEKSKVYYTDFRAKLGEGLPLKLQRLLRTAGIDQIDMDGKFVAIKMHFGELGNLGSCARTMPGRWPMWSSRWGASPSSPTATPSIPAAAKMLWNTSTAPGKTALLP